MDLYQYFLALYLVGGARHYFRVNYWISDGLFHRDTSSCSSRDLGVPDHSPVLGESVDTNSFHEISRSRRRTVE